MNGSSSAPGHSDPIDANTPVLVGIGEYSERVGEADYRGLSAVELAAGALRNAIADAAGVDADRLADAVEIVAAVRQFEMSSRAAKAPLGRSDNFPRSVAERAGVDPHRAILDVSGGQSPQHLVIELAASNRRRAGAGRRRGRRRGHVHRAAPRRHSGRS